jgi:hypothetical protein
MSAYTHQRYHRDGRGAEFPSVVYGSFGTRRIHVETRFLDFSSDSRWFRLERVSHEQFGPGIMRIMIYIILQQGAPK